MERPMMICQGCGKTPLELGEEYRDLLRDDEGYLPEPTDEQVLEAAWNEEGTLNRENGHFLCNECYIKAGMPSSPTGWRCP